MMTISLSKQREKAGPLSLNSTVLLSCLEKTEDNTKAISLLEKLSMMRSIFYKALYDLKDLGLVKLGHL